MEEIAGRYINPYTDYGFKLLFGTEPNKDITLELVNALLQGKEVIKTLTLLPPEQLGDLKDKFESEKVYYDNDGAIRTAEAKGIAKGRAEGRAEGIDETNRENARRMKAKGYSVADIADVTGLATEIIESL